jgi:hypothetical protein
MTWRWTLLCAGALLAGCSTTLVREDPQAIRLGESGVRCAMTPIVEALLAQRGTAVHAIQGNWKDHAFVAERVTKGEEGRFTAIFLAPQMRLATITLTPPHTITFDRARSIPSAFEPEYALFDLAVINLPPDVLRRVLGGGFVVAVRGDVREVSAGGTLIAVRTSLPDGTVRYENKALDYTYTLKEVR